MPVTLQLYRTSYYIRKPATKFRTTPPFMYISQQPYTSSATVYLNRRDDKILAYGKESYTFVLVYILNSSTFLQYLTVCLRVQRRKYGHLPHERVFQHENPMSFETESFHLCGLCTQYFRLIAER